MPFQNSNPQLPLAGRNVALTIFINGSPAQQTDLALSFTIDEVVTQFRDKYLGRLRDRTDEQTTGWDCKISLQYASSKLIVALLNQKYAREQLQPVPTISIGFTMQNRDGPSDGYVLSNCTSKISLDFKGKEDRGMVNLSIQAEDLVQRSL